MVAAAAVLAILVAVAGIALYTPDKSRPLLEGRYAAPPSAFITAAGARLHVRDTGPRDGPVLLMLHGFASSLQTWDGWAALLDADYRVIRIDLPGFALTGPDPVNELSDDRAVTVLLALMDQLGVARATLIGNSMGGRIAWRFAAVQPGRTERLVLIAPDGFALGQMQYGRVGTVPFTLRLLSVTLPQWLLRRNLLPTYGDPARLTDATVTRTRDMLLVPGIRADILRRLQRFTRDDPAPYLARIEAPTLVLWGERDRILPPTLARRYAEAIDGAEAAILPGLGHVPQEEAPAASLPPLTAFLARNAASTP